MEGGARKIRSFVEQGDGDDAYDLDHPPLNQSQIAQAEERLSFALPDPLRALYACVGNGGYGLSYGLLGLVGGAKQEDGCDAVDMFESYRSPDETDPFWSWPEKLLPVVHLGCAMFFCVDASSNDGMVVWFEPNPHEDGKPWTDSFIPLGLSFEDLMLAWVNSEDVNAVMAYNAAGPGESES